MSVAYWRAEMPRRAARWATEAADAEQARVDAELAARRVRAEQWPVERIRALMTETRERKEKGS
jgi:hypothetical protein